MTAQAGAGVDTGPRATATVTAVGLLGRPDFWVVTLVILACGGGVSAAQGALISRCIGSADLSRALGMIGVAAAPFLLGIHTLAGYLHDRTGDYRLAVQPLIATTAGAAMAQRALSGRPREIT